MVRPVVLLLPLLPLFAASLAAQAPADTTPTMKESANGASPRRRAISPEVQAQLSAVTPKFAPPPPKPAPKPEEELADARELDKPRNGIIRLPTVVVQEPKNPVLNERAVNTKKGLESLAVKRYISEVDKAMNRFTLPLFGESVQSRAMAMYAEEERLQNMGDLKDAATAAGMSDKASGSYILREANKTYLRSSDFGWNGGGPK
jgi:hypothetical protein